jgi:putative PEP-CTERM system TPR-repeat lipoprotein
MLKSVRSFIAAALVAALATACHGNTEAAKRKYVQNGDQFFRQGKYSEAVIEYANAIVKDPQFGEAHLKLADAYLAQHDVRDAVLEYIRAADLLPDDATAQLKASHFLLMGGQFEEARVRARNVLSKDPANVEALVLTGNALAGLKNIEEALGVLQHAIEIDPERAGIYTNIGVLQLARGNAEEAEAVFRKAIAVSKGSAEAHLGLGNFYRAVGRTADAEREIKIALQVDPKSVEANEALAGLFVETDRAPDAEPYLKNIVALSKQSSAAFALADYYASLERHADAIRTLEDIVSADPAQLVAARTRIAFIHYAAGDRDKAHATIDDVLARVPRNALAVTMKARLLLADGKVDAAVERARQAVEIDPRIPQVQLMLGRALVAVSDLDGARRAFRDALALDANLLPAELELVDLHQQRGELDTATQIADQAVRTHPASLAARLALVRVLTVRSEDHPRAQTELRGLLARYPKSGPVKAAQGAYLLSEGDLGGARAAFARALDLNPDQMDALAGIVAVDLATKNVGDARDRIDAVLKRKPQTPGALIMLAKVEFTANNFAKAEATLRRALDIDPSNPEPYGLLAQLYMQQGKLEAAKKEFSEIARLQSRSVGARTLLGVLCYATKDYSAAQSWWQAALRIDPNAAAAANNLAWLYAETGTNLESALELAQLAKAKMPDQPEINDTLGWVYYKKRMGRTAAQYLTLSIEKDRTNPVYQYHLGMAYAQTGEDGKARRLLEQALSLNPNFDGAAEARRTLKTLIY